MQKDKNSEKRDALYRAILDLEAKEDDFLRLKKRYERSLGDFYDHFSYLQRREEELLYEASEGTYHKQLVQDLEGQSRLHHQMVQYVEGGHQALAELEDSFRRKTDDQREQLIKERNRLPWD